MGCEAEPTVEHGIDPEIRALLVCPKCRGPLVDVARGLMCPVDRLTYPVVDGVPWMVIDRAKRATDVELDAACALWDDEEGGAGE